MKTGTCLFFRVGSTLIHCAHTEHGDAFHRPHTHKPATPRHTSQKSETFFFVVRSDLSCAVTAGPSLLPRARTPPSTGFPRFARSRTRRHGPNADAVVHLRDVGAIHHRGSYCAIHVANIAPQIPRRGPRVQGCLRRLVPAPRSHARRVRHMARHRRSEKTCTVAAAAVRRVCQKLWHIYWIYATQFTHVCTTVLAVLCRL